MGLMGRLPIRLAWYFLVWPSLVLNYFGQGALLLTKGSSVVDAPFFMMAPSWGKSSLLALSMVAALVAGHAVISGAFSMTRQAIQLGYLPRLAMIHTSEERMSRIYIPVVNWLLMIVALGLVVGFGSTAKLAAAYGLAVTGTMLISTILLTMVMGAMWGWKGHRTSLLVVVLLVIDVALFGANLPKVPDGGWVALGIAAVLLVLLNTWKNGRLSLLKRMAGDALPFDVFLSSLSSRIERVPGTAIFLTATSAGTPMAMMHNLKHNKVIHERVVLCTVIMEPTPFVDPATRLESFPLAEGFRRIVLRFGFMEEPNIPKSLAQARSDQLGFFYEPMSISYFLSRETLIPKAGKGLSKWREFIFAWMARSASGSMDFFHLPPNRVVELGTQVEL
jgi:KUP system potassium uptake protein